MSMYEMKAEKTKCPVCGKTLLSHFEICDICGWQNDRYQLRHPDEGGCANNMSLNEAREAYKRGEKVY